MLLDPAAIHSTAVSWRSRLHLGPVAQDAQLDAIADLACIQSGEQVLTFRMGLSSTPTIASPPPVLSRSERRQCGFAAINENYVPPPGKNRCGPRGSIARRPGCTSWPRSAYCLTKRGRRSVNRPSRSGVTRT